MNTKNYVSIRKEIDIFMKKSNKDKFITIFKQIITFVDDL